MIEKNITNRSESISVIVIIIFLGLLAIYPLTLDENPVIAESTWTQTTDEDFKNGTLNNLTIEGNGPNAELKLDLSDMEHWTKIIPAGTTDPGIRYEHAISPIWGTDKVLLFGGYSTGGAKNDTWVYDLSDNAWTEKAKSTSGTKPSARFYHGLAPVYNDDKVILSGGWFVNDTWVYDLSDDKWIQKKSKPMLTFQVRSNPLATNSGNIEVMCFSGFWGSTATYIYNLNQDSWTLKSPSTNPSARYWHGLAGINGTDKALLFSGSSSTQDTWIYDFSDGEWTKKSPSTEPSARNNHAMAFIAPTNKVLLFGGSSGGDETWVYDPNDGNEGNWTKVIPMNPLNKPGARREHAMAPIYGTDKVLLYGGRDVSWSGLNDTWIYKHFLSTKNGTYISGAYDTGSNSSFNTISWNAVTPENTSIIFQLRTADNESNLNSKPFIGPDGTTATFYSLSPVNIWSGHTGDRWIQYEGYLNINTFTDSPILKDLIISYNCLPNTIVVGPSNDSLLTINKPTFKWTFEDHDSKKQKAFQVLINDDTDFENVSYNTGECNTDEQRWEFPTGTSYTEIPDGKWYWKVRTKDEDGTWTEYSKPWSFTIDTKTPSSSPTFPINDEFYNSVPEISGLAFDPTDGSGVTKVEIVVKQLSNNYYWNSTSWVPLPTWLSASGTNNWTYDSRNITWKSGTRYNVQSRAMDLGNNIELPDSGNVFNIDKDNPFSSITYPINDTWLNKLEQISGSSADIGGSGVNTVEICIQRISDNNFWDGMQWKPAKTWLIATEIALWSYNTSEVPWTTGDKYIINSRATDKSGNRELPSAGMTFKYDDSPPEPLSIYINNGDEFTISTSVQLSLSAEDFGSGLTHMAFSTDGLGWSDWEEFNTTKDDDLPDGDGEKIVYFKVRDLAGNIAEPVSDSIILDTRPPKELSIVINDDDEYTTSDIAMLTLNALDSLSGLKDIAFSFDAVVWLSWETYKTKRSISLPPGDGEKRVYFKASDNAGNIAKPVYDTIIMDRTAPQYLSKSINDGALETNSTWVKLEVNAIDAISGVEEISYSIDNETWDAWEDYTKTKIYSLPPGDGEKTVYFKVKDLAGNIAEPFAVSIILHTSTPTSKIEVQPPEKTSPTENNWSLLIFLIILVIVVIVIVGLTAVIVKRKKRAVQELLPAGALTIKPGALQAPVITQGQAPLMPVLQRLPDTASTVPTPQPTLASTPTPVPQLVKSTQVTPTVVPQQTAQVPPPVPQLPPAQLPETKTDGIETKPEVTVTPTPMVSTPTPMVSTPTPTPAPSIPTQAETPQLVQPLQVQQPTVSVSPTQPIPIPQVVTTPIVTQPSIPSQVPNVHLPDSLPQPTTVPSSQPDPLNTGTTKPVPTTQQQQQSKQPHNNDR